MAYITDSVGQGGKNLASDVKVIQWMLKRSQTHYGINLFDRTYDLKETGSIDLETTSAIRTLIKYRKKASGIIEILSPPPLILNSGLTLFPDSAIAPDDANYKYLLKCSLKPICLTPMANVKEDFNNDPLAVQALNGKLSFQAFKNAAVGKDGANCGESEKTKSSTQQNQPPIPFATYKDSTVRFSSLDVVAKMKKIAANYHSATGSTLTITDGDRTALDQAYMIIRQIRKGQIGLYTQKKAAAEVKKAYDSGRAKKLTDDQIAREVGKVIQNQMDSQGIYISRHLKNRGADIRSRNMNAKELSAFRTAAQNNGATVLKEGDHLHLQF